MHNLCNTQAFCLSHLLNTGPGAWPRNPGLGVKNGPVHCHGAAACCLRPKKKIVMLPSPDRP